MSNVLHFLFVEDSPDDVFFISQTLKKGGLRHDTFMVENESDLRKALQEKTWDFVFTDFYLPQYDGIQAIQLIRSLCPELPCVMVSGRTGEETAVEAMKAGANDFIVKGNLSRLLPLVEREMAEAAMKISKRQTEVDLVEKETQYSKLFDQLVGAFVVHEMIFDAKGNAIDYIFLEVNPSFELHTGLLASEVMGKKVSSVIQDIESSWLTKYAEVISTGESIHFEDYSQALNKHFEVRAYALSDTRFATLFYDITHRKKAERNLRLSEDILTLLNQSQDQRSLVDKILQKIKNFTGVEAAGIRLKKDNTFPFIYHRGFSDVYLNSLIRIPDEDINRPSECEKYNLPYCLCGMIITCLYIPKETCLTQNGSFFCNSLAEVDLRNTLPCGEEFNTHCHIAEYESIAIIPIKKGKELIGVIQMNDSQKDYFLEEDVLFFENIAISIGIALKRISDIETIALNETRLKSLLKISQYKAKDTQSLLDYALSEAITLSNSKIGYIYLYSESLREFTLSTMSKEVMKECSVDNPPAIYYLEKTGFWGEAVRQRKAIINNQFLQPHPHKKGLPQGHCEIVRFMTIPVFQNNEIVAVVGLGNKPEDYTEADVMQMTLLMDVVWKITIQQRNIEQEKVYYHSLNTLSDTALGFLQLKPEINIFRFIAEHLKKILPYEYFIAGSYDSERSVFKVEHTAGFSAEQLLQLSEETGKNIYSLRVPIKERELHKIQKAQIVSLTETIREHPGPYLGVNLPLFDHLAENQDVYALALQDYETIYGAILLFTTPDIKPNAPLLGTFISQSAAALRRASMISILEQSEKRLANLFEKNNDIVFTMSPRQTILSINPIGEQLVTGALRPGMKIRNYITEESYARLHKMFRSIISAKKEYCQNEIDIITKNNSILSFKVAFLLTYSEKKLAEIFGIARNITTDKMLENQILSKIIETEEREKKTFAAELHDGLGSLLSTINIYVSLLQKESKSPEEKKLYLKELNKLVNDAVANVRLYANSLTPNVLNDFGLLSALILFCEKINTTRPGLIQLELPEQITGLSKIIEINAYRILMELINNSMKYANADSIKIHIHTEANTLFLEYTDDGAGFSMDDVLLAKTSGMGIRNIFARAKSLSGKCDFHSEQGGGVQAKISIPLKLKTNPINA